MFGSGGVTAAISHHLALLSQPLFTHMRQDEIFGTSAAGSGNRKWAGSMGLKNPGSNLLLAPGKPQPVVA